MCMVRTDLAVEATALRDAEAAERLPGVRVQTRETEGFTLTEVDITSEEAGRELGKPRGHYVTLALDGLLARQESAFPRAVSLLAGQLRAMLPAEGLVLVAGLGNRSITPDAIGPETLRSTLVTRHLAAQTGALGRLRPVAACAPGVLGTTGIESADYLTALCGQIAPAAVVAVDALAAADFSRLCATVQLTDTGIVPGSGVGNRRAALNREALGVPVIALGVPTVVDAGAFAPEAGDMFVTPRDIDRRVREVSRLLGYALNLALQPTLTVADVDMLLG